MHVSGVDRRQFLAGGAGVAALLGLAACSSGGSSRGHSAGSSESGAAGRTVEHKYGSTTLTGTPQRVITLGYIDQEPVLALGTRPVGVVDFFEERPYGNWPWEKSLWQDQPPQIVGKRDEYQFEKIATLEPDLIIGLYSGMTEKNYRTLSDIAPTVAQPKGHADFAAPWTVMTDMTGQCLGQQAKAKSLVAGVQAQAAAAARAHPQWKGRTVAIAEPYQVDEWAVFGAGDPKTQLIESLGFTVAPSVRKLEPGGDVAKLSTERLDLLDVDQLILLIDKGDQTRAQLEANPLFTKLAVAREKRTAFLPFGTTPPVGAALSFNSVLSIPYGIEHTVPALAD